MDNYKFLADEEELKFFYDYGIPPLKQNEIYFVSLSCRNKTLTEEEREYFKCGRSEMFAKQQIRHDNWGSFLQHIKRFECRKDAYLTKSGVPYPQKSLVVYFNIANIDAYKAMKDQMNHLTEIMSALTDSALKNSKGGLDEAYYKVRKSFDTCQSLFARNFGTKYWIDFDIDAENITDHQYGAIRVFMGQYFGLGEIMYVETAGGIHCLVKKEKLKMNPQIICDGLKNIVFQAKEIVRNSNEMIPCPGTWQYQNHVVKVRNKYDFNETMKLRKDESSN